MRRRLNQPNVPPCLAYYESRDNPKKISLFFYLWDDTCHTIFIQNPLFLYFFFFFFSWLKKRRNNAALFQRCLNGTQLHLYIHIPFLPPKGKMELALENPLASFEDQQYDDVSALFANESDHMPCLLSFKSSDLRFFIRRHAVSQIFNVNSLSRKKENSLVFCVKI